MSQKIIARYTLGFFAQLISFMSIAQSGPGIFYYYNNEKIYLLPDYNHISISVEGENNLADVTAQLKQAGIKQKNVIEDKTKKTLQPADQLTSFKNNVKSFYFEIELNNAPQWGEYKQQIESYKKNPGITMASPCLKTKEGNKLGLSNFFYAKLRDEKDIMLLRKAAKQYNIEIEGKNEFMPLWFTLSCSKSATLNALDAANTFYETGYFEAVEPGFIFPILRSSNDPLYFTQWGLKNTGQYPPLLSGIDVKAEEAWTITKGSPTIKVAIIDEGFQMNHPDLAANVFGSGYDAHSGTSPALLYGYHGTACAGIIGASQNNSIGVSGVAPSCRLISVSYQFNSSSFQQIANGINWAWQNGADVISNSWGSSSPSSMINNAISNALTSGRGGKGTVVVFAAGNSNVSSISYPARDNPSILVVGAVSPCGERKNPSSCDGENYWGSQYGAELDIVAPGVNISTTDLTGDPGLGTGDYVQSFNGTSSACPFVAGVAALILSVNPSLTFEQVNTIIEKSAQKVRSDLYNYTTVSGRTNGLWNSQTGYGLVNVYQALILAAPQPSCGIPTGLACLFSNTNYIKVKWDPVPSATAYNVMYKLTGSKDISWQSTSSTGTQASITGLSSSKSYDIKVQAKCGNVTGSFSAPITCTTSSLPKPCIEPSKLAVSAITSTSATLIWSAEPGATAYDVYLVEPDAMRVPVAINYTGGNTVSINTLSPATSYWWEIRSVCNLNNSPYTYAGFSTLPAGSNRITVNSTTEEGKNMSREKENLIVYPNPADEQINIQLPATMANCTIRVYDQTRKVLLTKFLSNRTARIDIKDLAKGLYIITVSNSNGEVLSRSKFVKQ